MRWCHFLLLWIKSVGKVWINPARKTSLFTQDPKVKPQIWQDPVARSSDPEAKNVEYRIFVCPILFGVYCDSFAMAAMPEPAAR